ncbi:hypothetical protein LTS12_023546 [Elasticomyces elasticus]|nr:hypothetical protein LTS12_023546 [Elasticomyces elasticus]
MARLKRVDGDFPLITQLSEIQDLNLATATRPTNLNETSELRRILHGLGLQYTLSRTSLSSLDNRVQSAKSKDLQWVPVGTKTYAIGIVEALCGLARAALGTNVDAQAAQPPQTTQFAGFVSGSQPPNNISKRKLSSTSLSADVESSPRESKRQMTAVDTHGSSAHEDENMIVVEEAIGAPYTTQTNAEGAHKSTATQVQAEVASLGALTISVVGYPDDSKARAEFEHKTKGGKRRNVRRRQHETKLDTTSSTLDAPGPDDVALASLECDDTNEDEGEDDDEDELTKASPNWTTCTTFQDGRDDVVTLEMITGTDELAELCPPELSRASAAEGAYHTQGYSTQQQIKPAAAVEGKNTYMPVYENLSDFKTLSGLIKNLVGRLLGTRSKADQFSSFSDSPVFPHVLSQRRETLGQGEIFITRVATREIMTPSGKHVKFYSVPELLDILGVTQWKGLSDRARQVLMGSRFRHEYVALGELDMTRNPYRPVKFDQLKAHGLYNFRPGLHLEGNEIEERKLYYRRLQLSHQWYGPETMANLNADALQFSKQHLDHAAELARLFNPAVQGTGRNGHLDAGNSTTKAPLSIFLDFIGLSRRRRNDQLFAQYIHDNYSSELQPNASNLPQRLTFMAENEVQTLLYEGMEQMYNNLPDKMQVLDRIREACVAVGVPEPAATNIILEDTLFDYDGAWHGDPKKITGAIGPWKKPINSVTKRLSPTKKPSLMVTLKVKVTAATLKKFEATKARSATIGQESSKGNAMESAILPDAAIPHGIESSRKTDAAGRETAPTEQGPSKDYDDSSGSSCAETPPRQRTPDPISETSQLAEHSKIPSPVYTLASAAKKTAVVPTKKPSTWEWIQTVKPKSKRAPRPGNKGKRGPRLPQKIFLDENPYFSLWAGENLRTRLTKWFNQASQHMESGQSGPRQSPVNFDADMEFNITNRLQERPRNGGKFLFYICSMEPVSDAWIKRGPILARAELPENNQNPTRMAALRREYFEAF